MVLKNILHHSLITRIQRLPKRVYIFAGLGLLLLLYIVQYIVPSSITYTYANKRSCMSGLTFLPGIQKSIGSSAFAVESSSPIAIGDFELFSTQTCVVPTKAPKEGVHSAAMAPFGGWLFRENIQVTVATAPSANLSVLKQPISTTKALIIPLTSVDVVHRYYLLANAKKALCVSSQKTITCDMASLGLEQGKAYDVTLMRSFNESSTEIAKTSLTTLTATKIIDGSIKPGDIMYSRSQELTFTADKDIKSAIVEIVRPDGKAAPTITTTVSQKVLTVKFSEELEREINYSLIVKSVEAIDGSGLTEPYKVDFRTSGGPKVTGINIGKSGVGGSAQVVVSFDQELSPQQDLAKIATLEGGAFVLKRNGNQVIYLLQNLPACTPFTVRISKGIVSKDEVTSSSEWSFASRVTCRTISTYGYSLKGRALQASTFGTRGPVTMYVGAIHGNEQSSGKLMSAWVEHLDANPSLYDNRRVVVVPVINPDGVASGTRTNSRGVNLNRNFPTDTWVSDIDDTDGQHADGGGSAPLSEPEANALATLTTSLRPRLLLSFHAIGSLVSGDEGGYSSGYAAKYASMVGYRNATGQAGTFDYAITGAYEDWVYAKQGIPSMVIELGSYSYYDFSHHRAALQAMLE